MMFNRIKDKLYTIPSAGTLLALLIIFFYRTDVTVAVRAIYPSLEGVSTPELLSYSMGDDMSAFILSVIMLSAIYLLPLSGKIRSVLSAIFLVLLHVFYSMAGNFFKTYETAFSTKYLSDEIATGMGEMIQSALSETPLSVYIKIVAGILVISAVFRLSGKLHRSGTTTRGMKVKVIAALAVLFFLSPYIFRLQALSGFRKENSSEKATVKEITRNPAINILFRGSGTVNQPDSSIAAGEFSFRFNTDSIVNKGIVPKIREIPRGKKYNIIFYFFESTPVKYFNLKFNGKDVMPRWHGLMKNSMSAKNHYANYPLSANAMLSLLTSAYSLNTKDLVVQKHSSVKLKSLPEILKKNGYRTAVIHTGDLRYAGQRRFLSYRSIDRIIDLPELEKIPPYNFKVGWGVDERAMIEPSVNFMKKSKEPFFITYMPCNPHHPYAIPDDIKPIVDPSTGKTGRERMFLRYINSLHYADHVLGMLMDRLEKEGLMENTILFLMADHGEAFYQHSQNYNHPFFLYEENVHVPMLIYNRRLIDSPIEIESITRHVDIPATVLDLLGIKDDEKYEGTSVLSARREKLALLHTSYKDDILGVRDGNWKYTRNMATGIEELFDLGSDPDERVNLVSQNAVLAKKFRDYVLRSRVHTIEYYRRLLPEKK